MLSPSVTTATLDTVFLMPLVVFIGQQDAAKQHLDFQSESCRGVLAVYLRHTHTHTDIDKQARHPHNTHTCACLCPKHSFYSKISLIFLVEPGHTHTPQGGLKVRSRVTLYAVSWVIILNFIYMCMYTYTHPPTHTHTDIVHILYSTIAPHLIYLKK